MAKELHILLFTFCVIFGSQGETCQDVESKAYTYHICLNSTANSLIKAREQCQNWDSKAADLMTFPTEAEFKFILEHLQDVQRRTNTEHYAFIGLYQAKDTSDNASPFNPQTGKFYWVTDPVQAISEQNEDFYYPFARFIEGFEELEQVEQQKENILISSTGDTYGGQTFNSPTLDARFAPLLLMCSKPGVSTSASGSVGAGDVSGIPLWLFITIIAGVVVGLLLLIIVIALVCRKCHESKSHKFSKVPVKDTSLTPTNSTYAQQQNNFQA